MRGSQKEDAALDADGRPTGSADRPTSCLRSAAPHPRLLEVMAVPTPPRIFYVICAFAARGPSCPTARREYRERGKGAFLDRLGELAFARFGQELNEIFFVVVLQTALGAPLYTC